VTYPLHGKESIKPCGLECFRTKEITATDMSLEERERKRKNTHTRKQTDTITCGKINIDTRHILKQTLGQLAQIYFVSICICTYTKLYLSNIHSYISLKHRIECIFLVACQKGCIHSHIKFKRKRNEFLLKITGMSERG
jgi:hypothetical protein